MHDRRGLAPLTYVPVVAQWLLLRVLVATVAAMALLAAPLPADPRAINLSPDYYAYAEVAAWLRSAPGGPAAEWLESLWRYDAIGYIQIARDGYQQAGPGVSAFPPLYPLAIRAVETVLVGQWVLSGLVVSALASLAAACLVSRLARREFGRVTRLAPSLLLLFPTAFFLAAPYAEGLFLALSVGCLLAGREQRWRLAGALGCLAALTRVQGITLAVPLAMLAWQHWRSSAAPASTAIAFRAPRQLFMTLASNAAVGAGVLGPPVGALMAEAYGWIATRDLGPIGQQATSNGWVLVVPGWPLVAAALELMTTPQAQLVAAQYYSLPLMLVAIGFLAWGWRRMPAYLAWYGLAVTLPGLSVMRYPALAGAPRYLLECVPLFVSMALWADRPGRRVPLVVISVLWQAILVALFAHWAWLA